jgi:interferon gamma-inducible protein 30
MNAHVTDLIRFQDYRNFESYICKAYKGNPPKACQGLEGQYPIIQQVVEAGNIGSYNSGDIEPDLAGEEGVDDDKMVLAYGGD